MKIPSVGFVNTRIIGVVICLIIWSCYASNSLEGDRVISHWGEYVNSLPRLLILTDIGGDPDDQQSLFRLSWYLKEFDVQGLIASASGTRAELKEPVEKPHLIGEIRRGYGKV